jgi:hypothetical protein
MTTLELANLAVDAVNARNREELISLMSNEVVLEGPFPLGTKRGPEKAAKMLIQVSKLGVKLTPPVAREDGSVVCDVDSPAGSMLLTFTSTDDGKLLRLEVRSAS